MAETDNDIARESRDLLRKIAGGGGLYDYDDDSKKKKKSKSDAAKQFEQSLIQTSRAFKILHGDTYQLSESFKRLLGGGAIATVVMSVINSLGDMTKSFSKMTDIGQNFGGSIFKMQEMAGESALSMEEFTSGITKASTVIATMSGDQVKGIQDFNKYQKGVRDSLKLNGYYGMSLSQLTDMSAEHADTLRETYQWEQLNEDERRQSTVAFVTNISAMAAATGKSREALAKQTEALLKSPRAAGQFANLTKQQQAAYTRMTGVINAASADAGKMFSEMLENQGRGYDTELGGALQKLGATDVIAGMENLYKLAMSGEDVDPQVAIDTLLKAQKSLQAAGPAWGSQIGELKGSVEKATRFQQQLTSINETTAQRMREAAKNNENNTTVALQNFETALHEVTGAFRSGFYKSIIDWLAPMKDGKRDLKQLQENLDSIKNIIADFGGLAADAFGLLLAGVTKFRNVIETILSYIPGFQKKETTNEKGEKVTEDPAHEYANYAIAGIIGAPFIALVLRRLYKMFSSVKSMFVKADNVILTGQPGLGSYGNQSGLGGKPKGRMGRLWAGTKRLPGRMLSGMGRGIKGGVGGLFRGAGRMFMGVPGLLGRAGGVMGGMAKGAGGLLSGVGGMFKGGMGMLKGGIGGIGSIAKIGLKVFGKGIFGAIVGLLVEPILNLFGNFKGKDSLVSMANYAGYGAMIGSLIPVVGTAIGALVGGLVGLIVENFKDITSNVGDWFGGAADWVVKMVHGIVNWFIDRVEGAMPDWLKKWLNVTCQAGEPAKKDETKKDETKPPAANDNTPADPFENILKGLRTQLPPVFTQPNALADQIPDLLRIIGNFTDDPEQGANAQRMLTTLTKLTPAMMAETVRLVQADPTHGFLSTPIGDEDTFDTLMERLEQATALRGVDEEQRRRGDESQKTLDEINAAIEEQTQLMFALLNKGNNQRDDAARKTGNALN